MNADRILKLAADIEEGNFMHLNFDMQQIAATNQCGSACCILGYALATKNGTFEAIPNGTSNNFSAKKVRAVQKEAEEWMGIDHETADILFFPDSYGETTGLYRYEDLAKITKHHAAKALCHLVETGEVDWKLAMETQGGTPASA